MESESDPLTRRAVDLFEKEPLKGNSEVHLHTPTKFGEDRSKDLGGDREQTDRQTNRQTDKRCSIYSMISIDQTKLFTSTVIKNFQVLSNTHVLGFKNTQQILSLPLTSLHVTAWDYIHSPGLPVTQQPYNTSYKNPCWNEEEEFYCLPYFFIGGFPKCGTTELYDKLIWHPEIISPARKEPHWWTRDRFTRDKNISYRDFFHLAANTIQNNPNFIAVDASASTTWDNKNIFPKFGHTEIPDPTLLTPHYIRRQLPRAKSVLIVRNPVTRLYSDFLYFHYKNKRKDPKIFHSVAKKSNN